MDSFFNHSIFVVLLYFSFSISEHLVHRYYMHAPKSENNSMQSNHWIHHEHTLNDMNLKSDKEYNSISHKYLGLFFLWKSYTIILLAGLIEGFLLYLLLSTISIKIKPIYVVLWVFIFSTYQTSFWNTVHPDIHYITENISIYDGIPGWNGWKILFSSIYINRDLTLYQWFKRNHTLHHLRKGTDKGNYNVTLPGADWIFGKMYSDVPKKI